MAFLGRINGPMLKDNLERQGVDLSFETDLLYLDVNNDRVGINTAMPSATLTLVGNALFANIGIDNNTISSQNTDGNIDFSLNGNGKVSVSYLTPTRILFVGAGNTIVDSPNITFDGSNLFVNGSATITDSALGNISVVDTTISTITTNSNLVLDPNGTGLVEISYLTADRILLAGANGAVTDSTDLTFSSGNLTANANVVLPNLTISGANITATDTNGNLYLNANGTGSVIASNLSITGLANNSILITDSAGNFTTDSELAYDLSTNALLAGNFSLSGTTLATTLTNSNLTLEPNGTGLFIVNTPSSMVLPIGTTGDRPTPLGGMIRYNSSINKIEWYNGTTWFELPTDTATIVSDIFQGDGSTTAFTLSQNATTAQTLVSINGVIQQPTTAYTVSGSTLTMTEIPQPTDTIEARLLTQTIAVYSILDDDTEVHVDNSVPEITFKVATNNAAVITSNTAAFNFPITSKAYNTQFSTISGATGTVGHNCSNGTTFVHNSIASDFTVNLTNLNLTSGFSTTIKLLLNQGSTPYVPTALQINSVAQTINWQGGSIAGNANKKDVVNFEIYNDSGTYTICANLVSFG